MKFQKIIVYKIPLGGRGVYSQLKAYKFKRRLGQARLSLHMSKCHIVGNHMSRLNYMLLVYPGQPTEQWYLSLMHWVTLYACMGICLEFICNTVCYTSFTCRISLFWWIYAKGPTFQMPTDIICKTPNLVCNACYGFVGCVIRIIAATWSKWNVMKQNA